MARTVISRLTEMRDAYVRRQTLRRELSTYLTLSEISDIEGALARCGDAADPETLEVRRILAEARAAL
jgi:hypothetical protein